MNMEKKVWSCASLFFVAVVALSVAAAEAEGEQSVVACNPVSLSSCLPAISSPRQRPTNECCRNLRAQRPCLCGYLRNPSYRQYLVSPGAKRVANSCGVPVPKC